MLGGALRLEGWNINHKRLYRVYKEEKLDLRPNGRSFRTLNVIDIFTRRCLAIEIDTSLTGERVVRVLDQLVQQQGTPKLLQIDNGPEFRCKKLDVWAHLNGVELHFIDPGKPLSFLPWYCYLG